MHYRVNKKIIKKNYPAVVLGLILLFTAGWLVYSHYQTAKIDQTKQEMMAIRDKVARLAILPPGEDPTLATVTDKNSLTDGFLKANVENGDKVLAYVKAGRVYIFRPSINKIVNIGPLTVDASGSEVQNARIMVKTGNNNPATSKNIINQLVRYYQSAAINQNIDNAARQDYPTSIIIDLTEGDKYDLVTNMMQQLGVQRGVLPQGETKPDNADILIITGLDRVT